MKTFTKYLFTLVAGCGLAAGGNYALDWWREPPAPPSAEAAAIIRSLESGEGWVATCRQLNSTHDEAAMLHTTSMIAVDASGWEAGRVYSLETGTASEIDTFSYTDKCHIAAAARQAFAVARKREHEGTIRRLTTPATGKATATTETEAARP